MLDAERKAAWTITSSGGGNGFSQKNFELREGFIRVSKWAGARLAWKVIGQIKCQSNGPLSALWADRFWGPIICSI